MLTWVKKCISTTEAGWVWSTRLGVERLRPMLYYTRTSTNPRALAYVPSESQDTDVYVKSERSISSPVGV